MLKDTKKFSKYDLSILKRKMSSWAKTATLMYKMTYPDEVKMLLFAEIHGHNRPYNVLRLYQRFNRLRCNAELQNISELVKDIEPTNDLLCHLRNQQVLTIYLKTCGTTQGWCLNLIRTELANSNRPYMIKLLYGRYQILRRAEEMKQYGIRK